MRGARGLWLIAIVPLLCATRSPAAETPHPLLTAYQNLQDWAFSSAPIDLLPGGMQWQLDVAEWSLDSGRLWVQRPTASGRVTGFVFQGSGHFDMAIPDRIELRQLRRFARDPELESLQETFDTLVVRGTNIEPMSQLPEAPAQDSYATHSLAKQRHQHWLALRGFDVDARLVAALGSQEDAYLRVDMKTREHGWLTFEYDTRRAEEIVVEWFNPAFSVLESWISLDQEADRLDSGRPSAEPQPTVDIQHVKITADLRKFARESPQGAAKIRPVDAQIDTEIRIEPLRSGDRAVQLFLHPWAKVETIWDEESNELAFVRDHLGKRSSAIPKRIYDDSLIVLLDHPLTQGTPVTLRLAYELEIPGFAPGRTWYPSATYPGAGLDDFHTASLTIHQRPNYATRSMGSVIGDTTAEDRRTTEWQIENPVKMLTFVFAKNHHEETLEPSESTAVVAFSSLGGFISRERVRELGEDTVQILGFFEELFDAPAETPELVVGLVPTAHGQAFDGLIHIGDYSTLTDRVAERELFRAHEVAHLWWGHQVGWHGYRDQWLSEGFAQYSAMMFVETNVDNGARYFQQMLAAFTDELTGSIQSGFSQFSQPGVSLLNKRAADRVGPIGHGRRCLVGEAPEAYRSQSYKRGALALHSLRMILRASTGSDDRFVVILRSFLQTYKGGFPSTLDFQGIVETVSREDWSWFFDAWIYGAEIPTYEWGFATEPMDDGVVLKLDVEQRQVRSGYSMAVPVLIELEDGAEHSLLAFVDQPAKRFEFRLEAEPRSVTFNPEYAVLARVKRN